MNFQLLVEELLEEADKSKMPCNKPRRIRKGEPGAGVKKFVVKACENGKEKILRFGDANLKIKKSNPKRRKAFRARHKCSQKKSKLTRQFWACASW